MSINQLLHIGQRALQAYDAGMNAVAQNVANADTEGYHRRRVTMSSDATGSNGVIIGPPGATDRMAGVSVQQFERVRDRLLSASAREAQTGLGGAEEEARIMGGVEGAFAVGTDGSLSNTLGDFWNAWSDVADNPTDIGARETLLSSAASLTSTFGQIDQDLSRIQNETQNVLSRGVEDANGLITKIADLNGQIQSARAAGSPNLSAEDERDQLVKQLASFAPVNVQEKDAGYMVSINGKNVVQGDNAQTLSLDETSNTLSLDGTTTQLSLSNEQGKLGAWTHTLQTALPGVRNDLDALADKIVTDVNDLHEDGYNLNDNDGIAFFAGNSASTISVNPNLTPEQIAASDVQGEHGNANQALDILDLREGIDNEAVRIVTDVGTQVEQANKRASSQSAVLAQAEGMERGVSGVSLDEEMTKMIEYQQAYAASSRVIQTAQQMMDTLLSL